jgi:mono/diheme cytochrome c family protein
MHYFKMDTPLTRLRDFLQLDSMFLLAAVFALAGCGQPPGAAVSADASTYSAINANIIQASCVHCHPGSGPGDFSSYDSLLASGTINPGNPLSSLFYIEVESGDMPLGGPSLSTTQVQEIYNWILAGAQNDQTGAAPSPTPSPSPSVLPAPVLSSVSPASGPSGGSTMVTLTGTGFQSGATATVGAVMCGDLTVVSATQITCVTGAHAAATVAVLVTNPDGQSVTDSGAYTYTTSSPPSPTVTAVSPASGSGSGGTSITVSGTNFVSGATVSLGGSSCASPIVSGSTSITCTTSVSLGGAVAVTVTVPGGQSGSLTAAYTYTSTYTGLNTFILTPKCLSCHSPGAADFRSYSSLMSSGVVTAGNAAGSPLFIETNDFAMPQGGPPLNATQIQAIEDWINNGASNN